MADLKLPDPDDGPRVQPMQPHQVSLEMVAVYEKAKWRWGIHNNLIKTMAGLPQLGFTEVDYANSFIFDEGMWVDWPHPSLHTRKVKFPTAGFIDRVTKELVINFVSLVNRSRYSITHHSMIGFSTISSALGPERAERMLLELVDATGKPTYGDAGDHDGEPLYSEYQVTCLDFARVANESAHAVSDKLYKDLRIVLETQAREDMQRQEIVDLFDGTSGPEPSYLQMWVDAMFLELSWNVCHFGGLLNRWFTILKMHDESGRPVGIPDGWRDEFFPDFVSAYNQAVPPSIRVRNNNLLGKDGFGNQ